MTSILNPVLLVISTESSPISGAKSTVITLTSSSSSLAVVFDTITQILPIEKGALLNQCGR
ncbi:hypothetical protein GO755_33530 [Spirosoma sp. HMF4905]|uniref:Uncharacterized protein n=1 Tax=Spirosoma arboris TaxID=2682092 RepID=A0A7K1SMJ0_9BACT|nr:hypothetical protein [Spirosoma arboris]MVM34998.1 hypothetical protein [Spirosoma arboris]